MESIIDILKIEPPVVLTQILIVVTLLVVMRIFLHRPIQDIFRERREKIAGDMAAAEEHNAKAETLKKQYEAHLADIANEARSRLDQAAKDAEAARTRLLDSAHSEISNLHERYRRQIAVEREQTHRELRSEIRDLATMAAAKALRTKLTPEVQSAVIDQVLEDLDNLPGNLLESPGEPVKTS